MHFLSVQADRKNIIIVQRPAIAPLALHLWRAVGALEMRRGIQDTSVAREKISARGRAGTGADQADVAALHIHDVHLIAVESLAASGLALRKASSRPIVRRLENELRAVK